MRESSPRLILREEAAAEMQRSFFAKSLPIAVSELFGSGLALSGACKLSVQCLTFWKKAHIIKTIKVVIKLVI